MKLQSKLALAFAGTLVVAAVAGCPTNTPTPTTSPTPTESTPASKLKGRVTFDLATDNTKNPGEKLTLFLKQKKAGETKFTSLRNATTSTDIQGNFMFEGLEDAQYQVAFDDGGKTVDVLGAAFNTTGIAVSDAVSVSKTQGTVPEANLEIAWNFDTNANYGPKAGTSTARQNVPFSWEAKSGFPGGTGATASYLVTIFGTDFGATLSSPSATVGTQNRTLTFGIPENAGTTSAGTYKGTPAGPAYYQVKYYKSGEGNGWGDAFGNAYGSTKFIKITITDPS